MELQPSLFDNTKEKLPEAKLAIDYLL